MLGSSSRPPVGQRALALHHRDLGVEQLVVHGDLAHFGFQPGDFVVAVIAFTFFQGCSRACERTLATRLTWRSRHSSRGPPVPVARRATVARQSPSCGERKNASGRLCQRPKGRLRQLWGSAAAPLRACTRHHSSCGILRLRFNLPQPGVSIIRAAPQTVFAGNQIPQSSYCRDACGRCQRGARPMRDVAVGVWTRPRGGKWKINVGARSRHRRSSRFPCVHATFHCRNCPTLVPRRRHSSRPSSHWPSPNPFLAVGAARSIPLSQKSFRSAWGQTSFARHVLRRDVTICMMAKVRR